jgi:hypothetical protein
MLKSPNTPTTQKTPATVLAFRASKPQPRKDGYSPEAFDALFFDTLRTLQEKYPDHFDRIVSFTSTMLSEIMKHAAAEKGGA